ncbi:MAG: ABC transporter ATP-binding protein, partial [Mycoplasma sp.]
MRSNKLAVNFKDVSLRFGESEYIFKKINFKLNYGRLYLINGYSGSGKSSLINMLTGVIPNVNSGYLSGDIEVNGNSIKNKKVSEICQDIGLVLQNPDYQIIQKYVEDEIAFGCENFNFDKSLIKQKIYEMTKLMNLNPDSISRNLSGGQKQKLITACALATSQKILVLDEPLANLDKKSSIELLTILKKLAKNNDFCILIAEHRIDLVKSFVDEAFIIEDKSVNNIKLDNLVEKTIKINDCDIEKTNQSKDVILSLKNTSYKINDYEILNKININIFKGEKLILLGENGCGKTTLMRIMARIVKPSTGNIEQFLLKNKLNKNKWYKKIGVVYQNPNYQLFMSTVMEEIQLN